MATTAKDGFEIYFEEKFWSMIPDIYRYNDGLQEPKNVLRAIISLMAEQAAVVRRSNDRLWEDEFIELCSEWAVPYIGQLVGTRMLSDKNKRGRRADVAATIVSRQRKGTPRLLEELISNISNWTGVLVESFKRLARAKHGLDPFPDPFAGRLTRTLPAGTADLREPVGSELADGPFDEYFHIPDMRFPNGLDGRWGIPKLVFYLYRLEFYEITEVSVVENPLTGVYCFDPSGRDIHLFQPRNRPSDWNQWHAAMEWELPAPVRCRLLGDAEYMITGQVIQFVLADPANTTALTAQQSKDISGFYGWHFMNESRMRAAFESFPSLNAFATNPAIPFFSLLLKYSIITLCGKNQLYPAAVSIETITVPGNFPVEKITAASLRDVTAAFIATLTGSSFHKELAIDPVLGRFLFLDNTLNLNGLTASYYYGFSGDIGAGSYKRMDRSVSTPGNTRVSGGHILATDFPLNGILDIDDNKTYTPVDNPAPFQTLTVEAGDETRPYLELQADWTFTALPNMDCELVLDGLWIGGQATQQWSIILQGKFKQVRIQNCTLDPGGDKNIEGNPINPVWLNINGTIDELCISNSITGPISIIQGTGEVEKLEICNSIIQSVDPKITALQMDSGKTILKRVTILGSMKTEHLEASDIVITEPAIVADTQHGCFRFSVAPKTSQLPRPYESLLFSGDTKSWFNSVRFGDFNYAQVSDVAPEKLINGGYEGYEIGAFGKLLNPFKSHDLQTKVEEYMPFGLIPIFIHQT